MATRIYLPNTGTAPITNATNDTWTETTGFDRVAAVTSRISSAMTSKTRAHTATAANSTFLSRQYVIGPLAGQTFGATTIKGTIRVLESAINDNLDAMRMSVRVCAPDGTTFRTAIWPAANSTVAEFSTSLRAKRLATGGTTTSSTITEGDYLIIEIGTTSTVGGTSLSDSISYGDDNATDLGDNETDTTALNPFIEFAANMKFLQKGFGQAQADILVTKNTFAQAQTAIDTGVYTASDAFGRTVAASSWGAADSGGTYTIVDPVGTAFTVDGSQGVVTYGGVGLKRFTATLYGVTASNITEYKTDFILHSSSGATSSDVYFLTSYDGSVAELGAHLNFDNIALSYTFTGDFGSDTTGTVTGTLVYDTVYHVVIQTIGLGKTGSTKAHIRAKFYTGSEPGWQIDEQLTVPNPPTIYVLGAPTFEVASDRSFVVYFDNFGYKPIGWTQYGQAQADIKVTSKVFAQAQANVATTRIFGRAAALIAGTYFLPFTDSFTRTVTDGLGSPGNGDTWVIVSGTAANADVNGTQATIITTSSTQVWELNKTLVQSSSGYEISATFAIDKIPENGYTAYFGTVSKAAVDNVSDGIGVSFFSNSTLALTTVVNGQFSSDNIIAFTPGDLWNFKAQILPTSSGYERRTKYWKVGDAEPNFGVSNVAVFKGPLQHIRLSIPGTLGDSNAPFTYTIDNLQITEAWLTRFAQAQAKIVVKQNSFAQAMARIGRTTYERILRGISGLQSFWTLGEPSGSTAISDYFGAITGIVNGTPTFSQASVNSQLLEPGIKFDANTKYLTFGDNYDLVGASFNFSVIIWFNHSGALGSAEMLLNKESSVDVGWSIYVSSTAATIEFTGNGGTNSGIIAGGNTWQMIGVSTAPGSGVIAIDQYGFGSGAGRAGADNASNLTIGRNAYNTGNAFNGTIGSVAIFNTGISFDDFQALYTIAKSGAIVRPAQAQARIKQTYNFFAQAQADIKATTNVFAQAQAKVTTTSVFGQAQAKILSSFIGAFAQGLGLNGRLENLYIYIDEVTPSDSDYIVWSMASTGVYEAKLESSGTPQYLQDYFIKFRAHRFADPVDLKVELIEGTTSRASTTVSLTTTQTTYSYTLSGAEIASIGDYIDLRLRFTPITPGTFTRTMVEWAAFQTPKPTGARGYGQAQAKIQSVTLTVYAQAQADIKVTTNAFAQAQGDIKATTNQFAQAQGDIKAPLTYLPKAKQTLKQLVMLSPKHKRILKLQRTFSHRLRPISK